MAQCDISLDDRSWNRIKEADCFGSPANILHTKRKQLDRLPDDLYLSNVMGLSKQERTSLMSSEDHRKRSFQHPWPCHDLTEVNAKLLAQLGWYYSGQSGIVICVFCDKQNNMLFYDVANSPRVLHHVECPQRDDNIEIPPKGRPHNIKSVNNVPHVLNAMVDDARVIVSHENTILNNVGNTGIIRNKSLSPSEEGASSDHRHRLSTFKHYPQSNPVRPEELSLCGFIHEGPDDKVRCVTCEGALCAWGEGDCPWTQHAKWYPGCSFVIKEKGKDFIRRCRVEMSPQERIWSRELHHIGSPTDFLYEESDSFQVCKQLGCPPEELHRTFQNNERVGNPEDLSDVQALLTHVIT